MKSFLKENPTIAFGLGLPLLLVIVFLLISGLPKLLVAPPQYNVVYATEYYDYGVQINVVDKKIQVIAQGKQRNSQRPHLWLYNVKTGSVKEIPIILPVVKKPIDSTQDETNNLVKSVIIEVPEAADLVIDSSSIAPDGYEFRSGSNTYSRNVFGGLFRSSRYYKGASLQKDGRSIRLPNTNGRRYYSNNAVFIGWVVSS